MNYKFVCFLVGLVVFTACNTGVNTDILSGISDVENIQERLLNSDVTVDNIKEPLGMISFGHYVIIAQDVDDHMVAIFNLDDGTIQYMMPKGHGRDELVNIHQLQVRDSVSFYVYDNFSQKMLLVERDGNGVFKITKNEFVDDFLSVAIDDILYLGCCVATNNMYKIYDSRANSTRYVGDYTSFELSPDAGKILLQGNIQVNPEQKRFIWQSFYGVAYQVVCYDNAPEIYSSKIFIAVR